MSAQIARRAVATLIGVVAVTAATTAATMTAAHAGKPTNGCPSGYSLLAVADLAPQGYQVPGQVDDPTSGVTSFGQPGNGDGLVCAQEVGDRTTPWGGQLYQFWDNTLSA